MQLQGIIASPGIAMGPAKRFVKEKIQISQEFLTEESKASEMEKLDQAFHAYQRDLEARTGQSETEAEVTQAHLELLSDPYLIEGAKGKITEENKPADRALAETIEEMASIMEALEDEYLRERGADYRDIGQNLLYKIKGILPQTLSDLDQEVIIVAEELTPSDTAGMKKEMVLGFANDFGGATSHTSIIAQTLGIPALVGMQVASSQIQDGDFLILDAEEGQVYINPDQATRKIFQDKVDRMKEEKKRLAELTQAQAISQDGHKVEVASNIGNLKDLDLALEAGAEGVGLFRTEFLYMNNSHFPSEEEQFAVYKEAAERLQGKQILIRTLDIGGDKSLSYFDFPQEDNPFLGWRALRIGFDMPEIFNTQLRAILRAGAYGNVKILLPMIISLDELLAVKERVEALKKELEEEGLAYDKKIQIGVMIETPASVFSAKELAENCDFFSIGTNDLTQYVLAADRGNQKIAKLYNTFNPAVLRAIYQVIQAAHAAGIWCGMCGGFAGESKATYMLLGMGLDEFSAPASKLTKIKDIVRKSTLPEAEAFAKDLLASATVAEVMEKVEKNTNR